MPTGQSLMKAGRIIRILRYDVSCIGCLEQHVEASFRCRCGVVHMACSVLGIIGREKFE